MFPLMQYMKTNDLYEMFEIWLKDYPNSMLNVTGAIGRCYGDVMEMLIVHVQQRGISNWSKLV